MLRRHFIINIDSGIPNNEIWYTSFDGNVVTPNAFSTFGANIESNTYENGKGVITFDGDITHIGGNSFYNCYSLTSITIPNSVTSIGDNAFWSCSSLTSIIFKGTKEEWNAISKGYDWAYDVPATVVNCIDGDVEI